MSKWGAFSITGGPSKIFEVEPENSRENPPGKSCEMMALTGMTITQGSAREPRARARLADHCESCDPPSKRMAFQWFSSQSDFF